MSERNMKREKTTQGDADAAGTQRDKDRKIWDETLEGMQTVWSHSVKL